MPIKIGDKEYSDEQIISTFEDLKTTQDQLVELKKQFAPVLKATERYDIDVDRYMRNAEGAFDRIFQLQEAGVLDQEGKLVKTPTKPEELSSLDTSAKTETNPDKNSVEAIVAKALQTGLADFKKGFDDLNKKVETVESLQSRVMRERLMSRVQEKFPDLNQEDVSVVMAKVNSQGGDFWDEVEKRSNIKQDSKNQVIKDFAKQHNLDLDQLNKLQEMKSDEGAIANAVVEGKKISFKGGDDKVTPKEAMKNYFNALDRVEGR